MIHVIATIEIAPGRRDEFLAEFRRLVPLVRAEQGCLEYGPAVDTPTNIPAQPPLRENVVVVIEKWSSYEDLQAHLAAPHMISYRSRVKELVAGATIHVLQPAQGAMREVIAQLAACLEAGRPTIYCRLVETRGSTPQKAGAVMLVHPDGSQSGTLGGGCVEAEVKRRALSALLAGQPEVARFQLDSDYGWDDGLICGGRMQVLIQPLNAASDGSEDASAYFRLLGECVARGDGLTEAVAHDAACGLAVPASFLFDAQGRLLAALHAPSDQTPAIVAGQLRPLSTRPRAYASQGVAYLPLLPRCRLLIVGGGHVGQAVGALAADLEFDVWVVDDREEFVRPERFPRAARRICGPIGDVLPSLEITSDTYCLIVTRGHSHDEQALFHLAQRGARYVGLIGSRRKIRMIFDDLLAEGIAPEALEQVHAPLGIDIGSQTVAEIAVSICAELVSHRNRGGVVPGRPEPVNISR